MDKKSKFTIYHGFAASLAVHSAFGLPFVLHNLTGPSEKPQTLVVELQGVVADSQSEQKILQETKGEEERPQEIQPPQPIEQSHKTAQTPPQPQTETANTPPPQTAAEQDQLATESGEMPPPSQTEPPPQPQTPSPSTQTPSPPTQTQAVDANPPVKTKTNGTSSNTVLGSDEQQDAQTVQTQRDAESGRLKDYVKSLSKKVQANLVYPDDGRQARLQGTATVSFTILSSGQIRPESLKIVASSGQPKLDASALKTVRASGPFDPLPKDMTVAIAVGFGRK